MKELLKQLIQTAPVLSNGELKAAEILADYFRQHNINTNIDQWDNNRANFVAFIGNDNPDTPTLIFGSHLDVVPATAEYWQTDPFNPVEKDSKIFGRGAVDMLGGLCAAASALVDLSKSEKPLGGRVILAATAGEETDSSGIKQYVNHYQSHIKNPVGIVITEPTEMKIMRAHRGILWLNVKTIGKTAHGSMPHLGVNAILKMNALLDRLLHWKIPFTPHPLLGGCSISPNRICGGNATNIIPDSCCLEVDIRTLPGQCQEDLIQSLNELCHQLHKEDPEFNTEISILRAVEALETPADSPFIKDICEATDINETSAAGFTTDGPYFQKLNAPVVIFGPGDGSLCHKPDEYIESDALDYACRMYKSIAEHILQ